VVEGWVLKHSSPYVFRFVKNRMGFDKTMKLTYQLDTFTSPFGGLQ
jgi:hypothetical protein